MLNWKPIILILCLIAGSILHGETGFGEEGLGQMDDGAVDQESSFLNGLELHLSLSQGYLNSSKNNWIAETRGGTFDFNEFVVNASYDLTDSLRVGLQVISRDFGPLMNNTVYLDWMLIDYRWRNELGGRIGRLRTPFGLYNASRDVDAARISILLPNGVYPERARDQAESLDGGALYGTIDMGKTGVLEYFAGYGRKELFAEGGTAHYLEDQSNILDAGSIATLEADQVLNFQISYDLPIDGLRLVGSYAYLAQFDLEGRSSVGGVPGGPASIEVPKAYSWVGSLEYTRNNFIFAAEYRYLKTDQRFTFEKAGVGTVSFGGSVPSVGWYVSGSYRFSDWLAAELYYSELYPNSDDRDGSCYVAWGRDDFLAWQKDLSFTGRFDITDNWIFKAGVTFSNGLGGGFPADYPVAGVASEDWILYQLKLTFVY